MRVVLFAAIIPCCAAAARGQAASAPAVGPLDLLPADNLLCWKGLPLPDVGPTPEGPSSLGTLIDLFGQLSGKLGPKEQLTIRVFETLGVVAHYPFAVVLIDTKATGARADGSGSKVDELRIAAAIKTRGDNRPFLRIIQKTVRSMTDAGVATLEKKKAGRWVYQELRDSRLPPWCVIAWGRLDDHFVITVGRDVWPLVASVAQGKTASINADPWVSAVRAQFPDEPLIEVFVSVRKICKRLDPFVRGRATAFFNAWNCHDVIRSHWALGFKGRALYCVTNSRLLSGTSRRVYADPDVRDPHLLATIPPQSRYAIYNVSMARFLPRLISSYYATRSTKDREEATRLWNQIQAELKIDAEKDVLANLGRRVVLHNYPRHPLHLPLAFTTLIEIEQDPARVHTTLEKLCEKWREGMDKIGSEKDRPITARLERDDDGIWFVQIGPVAGLAWIFTDHYIVTSWSPKALRDYLEHYGDKLDAPSPRAAGRPPTSAPAGGR